jgi:hypothetical protein
MFRPSSFAYSQNYYAAWDTGLTRGYGVKIFVQGFISHNKVVKIDLFLHIQRKHHGITVSRWSAQTPWRYPGMSQSWWCGFLPRAGGSCEEVDVPHCRVRGAELLSSAAPTRPRDNFIRQSACTPGKTGWQSAIASVLIFHWVTLISPNLTHSSLSPLFQNMWYT